jgi:purine nucleosidase
VIRVILDTDLAMGALGSEIDDGFALALAVAEPEVAVELVTTVNGNTDVESATLLSIELLDRLGRSDVPVVRGAAAPLLHPGAARGAPDQLRAALGHHRASPGYAAAEIARRVLAAPGEITIVAIGPLTNIAAALNLEPRLAGAVKEIVVMGGVYLSGAHTRRMPGEFNFWSDPEAASAVLDSGAPVRLVGLDVTLRVRLTRDDAAAMAASGRSFGELAGRQTLAWIDHMHAENPGDARSADSCAMHDPLAMAVVGRPGLVTWRPAHVEVVTGSGIARGVAVTDLLTFDDPPAPNCQIAVDVDVEAFRRYFLDRIAAL